MRRAFGTILPSANRSVERAIAAALRCFPDLDACHARIPFHGAGLGQPPDGYDAAPYEAAAHHLRHAQVEVVCWNGTRGAGLGLDADRALCTALARAAGVPATTTALATATLLGRMGARRLGLVGANDTAALHEAARGLGGEAVAVTALGLTDNLAAAAATPDALRSMARQVAQSRPDAILIWSTNLPGFEVAAGLEAELGLSVLDSALVGVWACLEAMSVDRGAGAALGSIFRRF